MLTPATDRLEAKIVRLGNRRPNTAIMFIDSHSEEVLLQVASDPDSVPLLGFRLYDAAGELAAESDGMHMFPDGLTVTSAKGELLLQSPANPMGALIYRLYNRRGDLLTYSDGTRTQIFGFLRIESTPKGPQIQRKA